MDTTQNNSKISKKKIAIFHHFLLGHCKGGGEKLVLQLKDELNADLWIGSMDNNGWGEDKKDDDDFNKQLWNGNGNVFYLHKESNIPIWKYVKRQLFFLFSPKIRELALNYDYIIYSFGNIAFVPLVTKFYNKKIKSMAYIHTPPRAFADQFEEKTKNLNFIFKALAILFKKSIIFNLQLALKNINYIVTNSVNIKNRTEKYVNINADEVIWPPTETERLKFIEFGDYFHSHGRLEDNKRIKLIVNAFEKMPNKKLVITSSGPLKSWVENEIKTKNLTNIVYKGRVSDDERDKIMGKCLCGIYIPVDEDAGITQYEFMACGKPVIGVKEGGLLESIDDGVTGFLINANPSEQQLISCVNSVTLEKVKLMKEDCIQNASKTSLKNFILKINNVLNKL